MSAGALLLLATAATIACDARMPIDPAPALAGRARASHSADVAGSALFVGSLTSTTVAEGILIFDGMMGSPVGSGVFAAIGSGPADAPLTNPCCMTFGPDGHLYVGNLFGTTPMQRGIYRYHGITGEFIDVFVPGARGGLLRPLVMQFGPDGHLYVGDVGRLDLGGAAIRRYDGVTGEFIDNFVPSGSGGMLGMIDPQLFEFGPGGDLYVASQGTHRVLRFDGTTGAYEGDFVPAMSGGLTAPSGITFGPDGRLYAGSTDGNRVLRFDGASGAFVDEFVSAGSGGLSVPVGLTFGPDGHLYVASATSDGTGSILRYDGATGAFLDAFVPTGTAGLSGPRYILFREKADVCHAPRGNPGNGRSLTVSYLSGRDHIAHGDHIGRCKPAHRN